MLTTSLTSADFRRVVGNFATGITVITVEREPGQVHGMTANSFASVSLDPLLFSFASIRMRASYPSLKNRAASVSTF